MVSVDDFLADDETQYTHLYIDDDDETHKLNIDNADTLTEILESNKVEKLYELVKETMIPAIIYDGDPELGAKLLQSIMKTMYNVHSVALVLTNPDYISDSDDAIRCIKYVICSPYARVNKEMMREIQSTFEMMCSHYHVTYKPRDLYYMPLYWEVTAYKDGSKTSADIYLDNKPSIVLSTIITNNPINTKVKMSSTQMKKQSLIQSILMHTKEVSKTDTQKAEELAPLINRERSKDMAMFLTLGRCFWSIYKGDGKGIETWRSCCVPYAANTCEEFWPGLETTSTYYSIHTLQYWAKCDSPEKYKEWNKISISAALEASVLATGGVLDIAQVAYRKNPALFICDGDEPKEAIFFKFNGNYYKQCGVFAIQDYLDNEIIPEFEEFLKDISKILDANPSNDMKEIMDAKVNRCIRIIVNLKKDSFQNNVIKSLMRLYNKSGFDNIRDSNPNLTVFEDCVFDLERGTVRSGIPEDYCSVSTGYSFKDAWDLYEEEKWEHPDVKLVMENIKKFMPDDEKREFILRELASLLHVSNPYKRGVILYGRTNDGKSALYSWLGLAFGPHYWPDVPNNLLYSVDSHPGGATPHFEMLRFARGFAQMEVSDDHSLYEPLFKRITGACDKLTYRGLYQRKIKSFVCKARPHCVCNSHAKINGNSSALVTRIVVINCDSKFITQKDIEYTEVLADKTPEEQEEIMRKNNWHWANVAHNIIIERTYKAFMWVLIQYALKYKNEGTIATSKLPKSVTESTLAYFRKANIYLQFIQQAVRKVEKAPGVSTYAMYSAFKRWFVDSVAKFGYVSYSKFLEELEALHMKPINDMYMGIVLSYASNFQ